MTQTIDENVGDHHTTVEIEAEPPAPANEPKADAFKRLANSRVNAAIHRIELVGNLANRYNYEYTEEQVASIEASLVSAIAEMGLRFRPEASKKPKFQI